MILQLPFYTGFTKSMYMPYDMHLVCKFCNEDKKTNTHGYCGECWSQLERIESDGDILIRLDKTLDSKSQNE